MDEYFAPRIRLGVGLGVALFVAGGLYGWFAQQFPPGADILIPLQGFADPGTIIWLLVIPAVLAAIAPLHGKWPLLLWFAGLPLAGLVLSAWVWGRGAIWNGGVAEEFAAGLIMSSVGAGVVLAALTLALALRE